MKTNKPTVGDFEKKHGIKIPARNDMKISTYLGKIGFPSLQKLIEHK